MFYYFVFYLTLEVASWKSEVGWMAHGYKLATLYKINVAIEGVPFLLRLG